MVCMAIEGAMSVKGGNWQIFHNFVEASGANLRLNTTVMNFMKQDGKYLVRTSQTPNASNAFAFDAVVLAAPLQFSGIQLPKDIFKHVPDEIPYVKLHVTLFTSPLKLNGAYFNLKDGDE